MAAWFVLLLALCSSVSYSQGAISCSDLTPCRTIIQQHCESTDRLCVGYYDCKSCPRRVCAKEAISCSTRGSETWCAVERSSKDDRKRYCTRPNDPALLKKCENPTGDCDWYINCMNRYFPACAGDENYGVNFGKKYCERYNENYSRFSPNGQFWIDQTRQCLQDRVKSQLTALPASDCVGVKDAAFRTHTSCYVKPSDDSSVCDLGPGDIGLVLTTTKGGFVDEFTASLVQGGQVLGKCTAHKAKKFAQVVSNTVKKVKFTIKNAVKDAIDFVKCDIECEAEKVTKELIRKAGLKLDKYIEWYAIPRLGDNSDVLEIDVLFTNKKSLTAVSTPEVDAARTTLQTSSDSFFKAVAKLKEVVFNGKSTQIQQVSSCGNLNCDKATVINTLSDIIG